MPNDISKRIILIRQQPQEEHKIVIRTSSHGSSMVGTVAKVEANVFLFIEGVIRGP